MKKSNTIKYAILIAVALIVYFVLIDIIGYGAESWLSFFNAVIVGVGLFFVIRDVYEHDKEHFEYMEGFVAGIKAGFISTTIYTIFMAIYLFEINPDLAEQLEEQVTIAGQGIEVALLLFIFLSGLATSIVVSLLVIPIYKQSWNTRKVRAEQEPMNDKH
ncbi:Protein of unknown function [Nonlabens sp. Hel1_33_55]|uniref:DUF4199 domain-containing protein n=1 Tax=Nonlabens sp. Hel1_33_55 TaxID=1336802 RepID=UPI000875BF3C|nr:DUF4199 domain-containing protein [Nonlabens sp. Hel1_33_55]SCY36067.1 Protein of unknown function [Nonlabens sp. Hel1_33_55]